MKKISLVICLLMISACLQLSCTSRELVPVKEYRKDFWVQSEYALGERFLIKVLLPDGYYRNEIRSYPVLYLTDADWLFGLAADRTLFIGPEKRKIILVGISYGSEPECWSNRAVDFATGLNEHGISGAVQFQRFLRDELIPVIESRFRTDSDHRTLFGWSSGGGYSVYAAADTSDPFQNYIIGGWIPEHNWVTELQQRSFPRHSRIYLGCGEYDHSDRLQQIIHLLEGVEFQSLEVRCEIHTGGGHDYTTLSRILINALDFIYQKESIANVLLGLHAESDAENLIRTYHRLKSNESNNYSFSFSDLERVRSELLEQNEEESANAIAELMDQEYPQCQVEILVTPTILPEGSTVYLTGITDWNPASIVMEQTADGMWRYQFQAIQGSPFEFKITRGSWDKEAATASGDKFSNFRITPVSDTTLRFVIENWADLPAIE